MKLIKVSREPCSCNEKMYTRKSKSQLLGVELKVAVQTYLHLHPELRGNLLGTGKWNFEINGKPIENNDIIDITLEEEVTDYRIEKEYTGKGSVTTKILDEIKES